LEKFTNIIDELATFWGEFVDVDGGMRVDIGEGVIDLMVVWHTATAEGLDNAIEAHLGGDNVRGNIIYLYLYSYTYRFFNVLVGGLGVVRFSDGHLCRGL
jgi:hypothetical protein